MHTSTDVRDPRGAVAGGRGCRCAEAGAAGTTSYTVVSRHATSEGMVVYARCGCGRLRVLRLSYESADEVLYAEGGAQLTVVRDRSYG